MTTDMMNRCRLPRLDVTLVLDRIVCLVRGHVPAPYDHTLPPWARPRCERCHARLDRAQGTIFPSAGSIEGGSISFAEITSFPGSGEPAGSMDGVQLVSGDGIIAKRVPPQDGNGIYKFDGAGPAR